MTGDDRDPPEPPAGEPVPTAGNEIPLVTRADNPAVPVPVPVPRARPKPGFWQAVGLSLGFLAVLYGGILALLAALLVVVYLRAGAGAITPVQPVDGAFSFADQPQALNDSLVGAMGFGYVVGLAYALLVARFVFGAGWTRSLGFVRPPATHLVLAVVAIPGFMVLSAVVGERLFKLFGTEPEPLDLKSLFGSFHWSVAVLVIGVAPGVVEEIWCRGFLGRGLMGRYGVVAGVALTSLFFGALHAYPFPYVLTTAVMGVMLHAAYLASRTLWVPITVHFLNNSLSVLSSFKTLDLAAAEAFVDAHQVGTSLLAAGSLLFVWLAMRSTRGRVVGPDGEPVPDADPGAVVPADPSLRVVHSEPLAVWVFFAVASAVALLGLLFR